ncbi:MAG TPA: hypothetical protein VKU02_29110 [Gemmataceae bacterium]|nr:hypothetical protein [Gemmataceae bacterium]
MFAISILGAFLDTLESLTIRARKLAADALPANKCLSCRQAPTDNLFRFADESMTQASLPDTFTAGNFLSTRH